MKDSRQKQAKRKLSKTMHPTKVVERQLFQVTRREILINWTIYNEKLKRFIKTTLKKSATKERRFLL